MDKQCAKLFIEIIKEGNNKLVENALWALGNMAGDSPNFRNQIIREGAILVITNYFTQRNESPNCRLLADGCWALSNILRGNPLPDYNQVKAALPLMISSISKGYIRDMSCISDCLWAISYHTGSGKGK